MSELIDQLIKKYAKRKDTHAEIIKGLENVKIGESQFAVYFATDFPAELISEFITDLKAINSKISIIAILLHLNKHSNFFKNNVISLRLLLIPHSLSFYPSFQGDRRV